MAKHIFQPNIFVVSIFSSQMVKKRSFVYNERDISHKQGLLYLTETKIIYYFKQNTYELKLQMKYKKLKHLFVLLGLT